MDKSLLGIMEIVGPAILLANRALLDDAAGLLLANETLSGVQLDDLLRRVGRETGPRLAAAATA